MPAKSKKMRRAAAIAEHHPEMLYKRNMGMLGMTSQQLHDYAATKEKGLPVKKKTRKKRKASLRQVFR